MVRIVFTADNHLGKHYAKMSPSQLDKRRKRLREAWRQTVDYAIEKNVHLYLHGGDLFDTPNPRTPELIWVAHQFRRLQDAGILTLVIAGNHDVPRSRSGGATPQRIYGEVRVARCFTKTTTVEWELYTFGDSTVAIGGLAPDPRLSPEEDPLEGVEIDPPEADVVLLMVHYGIEGTLPPDAREPQIAKSRIASLKGIDYLLVGHLHEHVTLQIGGVKVCSAGPTERMNFGEINVRPGFVVMEFSGGHPVHHTLKHVPIRPQPMKRIEIRTTDLPHSAPSMYVQERLREVSHPDQLLQCRIAGPLSREMYREMRFFDIWRLGNELNAYFDLDRREVYVLSENSPEAKYNSHRVSPLQEIDFVAEELIREHADEEEKLLVEEARDLIFRTWEGTEEV